MKYMMMPFRRIVFATLALVVVCGPAAIPQENRFAKGDSAYLERASRARAYEALTLYRQMYHRYPDDPEAAWRLSMACYYIGFKFLKNNDEQAKMFAEGRDAGLAAVQLRPGSAEAHFWVAINMALYGQSVGVLKMLFTLGSVRDHLNKAVAIDPKYAYGGAYRILGKIDESLPGVLGGSRERARQYYEKAIEAAPDEPVNYFFLAKLLKYSYKDTAGARVVALKGMNVPPPEPFRAESIDGLVELQDFITTQLKE